MRDPVRTSVEVLARARDPTDGAWTTSEPAGP